MSPDEILVEVQKGLRVYKAFAEAEKIVLGVQNAAQVERETQARVDALRKDVAAAESTLADVRRAAAGANMTAAATIADATARAKTIVADAKSAAESVRASATEAADAVRLETEKARERLTETRAAANAAEVELAALTDKLKTAKAEIAKLLG